MKYLFLIFCLITPITFFSQNNTSTPNKPIKIGLVLSGGGAKGFAHVGALKAFEEAGIKIDYIAGSSMGAAVGALYASGYNAKQVDSIIVNTDFSKLLTDQLDRKYFSFYQKKNEEKYIFKFPIKNWIPELPIALSKGQNTYNKLNELYHHVDHIHDFSKLPIPFFCMATDLETGKAIEINKGDLALAIRSSASLPTLLSPSNMDNHFFIDGGISDNFPVEKMREKNVDFIIGIDVQGRLKKSQKLGSALNVIEQIVNYQLYGDINKKVQKLNVHIKPEVSEFSIVDFDKKKAIIEAGYQKTKKNIDQFLKTIETGDFTKKNNKIQIDKKEYTVSQINYEGLKNYSEKYISGKMNLKPKTKISLQQLNDKINLLTATDNFNHIHYSFKENESSTVINFEIKENPYSQFLKIGGHYDPLYKSAGLLNYTHQHILLQNDYLSFDIALGDNLRYDLNYFIDNGYFMGYGFKTRYNQFSTSVRSTIFSNISRINFEYQDYTNYLYAQGIVKNNFTLSVGLEHKHIRSFTNNFGSVQDDRRTLFENNHYLSLLGKLEIDTYDNKNFPTKGFMIDANWRTFLAASHTPNFTTFSQVNTLIESAWALTKPITFIGQAHAAFTVTSRKLQSFNYSIGGYGKNYINNFIPFYGYEFADISAESFAKISGTFRYNIYKKNYLDVNFNYAYVASSIVDIVINKDLEESIKSGFSIGWSADTIIGPIDLRYACSPENNFDTVYFSIGHWF